MALQLPFQDIHWPHSSYVGNRQEPEVPKKTMCLSFTIHLLHHLPWFTMSGQHLNIETYFNHHFRQHFPIDFTQPLCQALWCWMLMHPGLPLVGEALVNHPTEKKGHPAIPPGASLHEFTEKTVGWKWDETLRCVDWSILYIYLWWIFCISLRSKCWCMVKIPTVMDDRVMWCNVFILDHGYGKINTQNYGRMIQSPPFFGKS